MKEFIYLLFKSPQLFRESITIQHPLCKAGAIWMLSDHGPSAFSEVVGEILAKLSWKAAFRNNSSSFIFFHGGRVGFRAMPLKVELPDACWKGFF